MVKKIGTKKQTAKLAFDLKEKEDMAKTSNLLISFHEESLQARFLRREKRFLVEVETREERFWVHCNNSGSMLGLMRPGAQVLISPAARPGRKLKYTLEMIKCHNFWVGVNTLVPNRLLKIAWKTGLIPDMAGYERFRQEAAIGSSRLDALLDGPKGRLWIEAKNVTLVEDDIAYFPDAITLRGRKHLQELMDLARQGHRVACFCLIQRPDALCFAPADFIDPIFSDLFWKAVATGVEIWPYQAMVSPRGIGLGQRLPLQSP